MKNIRFYETKKRLTAFVLMGTIALSTITLTSCNKKEKEETSQTSVETIPEEATVNTVKENIKKLFPEMNDEIVDDTTLILLLNILAKEDENGKISADVISNFKSKIDSDNIMDNFNAFLSQLENGMIKENKIISMSNVLPQELDNDKVILSHIEKIVENIKNSTDKATINKEFTKLTTLFVEEDELEVDGFKFEIRDLTNGSRALAQAYARTAAYFARNYITEEQAERMDNRTNNQNNKAYIKTDLEVLGNQIDEVSEIDVVSAFDNQYLAVENYIDTKVDLSSGDEKDLVNYLNLKYLASDKVATKDKNQILNGYEEEKVNDVILSIDAINTYNLNNQNDIITFSNLLVGEYKNTQTGQIDKVALDFVQYNSIMLLNTVEKDAKFTDIFNNPYFQNLKLYIMRNDFTHKYNDGDVKVQHEEISGGANLINNEIIRYTLSKLPQVKGLESFVELSKTNLEGSIQYVQNIVTGECEKAELEEFVKTK
ncbi:MAG: hypothetical protein IJY25_01555 [Bacilli bacterium]|nr:hypothetical protein [Bacilli bacterium]